MKCDKIRTRTQGDAPFFPNMLNNCKVEVCLKEDVDAAIAEKDAEIAELKAENESLKYSVATLETDIAMMKRWRKMSEELPKEEDEYYLVFDKYGYMDTDRWRKDKLGVWGFSVHGETVRYFMPLPSAPKEDK